MADKELSMETRIFSLQDIKTSAPATKVINNVSVSTSDIQIDPSHTLWFRLFAPTITETNSDTKLPLILYFHGGGFRRFGPDTKIFDDLCSHIAARVPAVVASINYRLTPEHKCPSQYDDAYNALKFIDSQNTDVLPAFTDISNCFIGGDSAGGNIAHHVTVRALQNGNHFNRIKIAGVLSLQPAFGGEERTESELRLGYMERTDQLWRDFLPEGADRNHSAIHVFGDALSTEEVKNLEFPPTLVIVGGNDPLQDWDKRYAEWLKNCGKEAEITVYPDAGHAFYAFTDVPEFDMLLQRMKDFVQKYVHPISK